MTGIDDTHDPDRPCWVPGAHDALTDFPIQNLPFGVYRKRGTSDWRTGVAIGTQVFDLVGVDADYPAPLNGLASAGRSEWERLRRALSDALTGTEPAAGLGQYLTAQEDVEMRLPVDCGDYTDFFSSYHHAFNAGSLFRPDHPMTPNFVWMPIAYHGRSSSIVVSGTDVRRPSGQSNPTGTTPSFGPSQWLDHEVELGLIVGPGNEMGTHVPIEQAEDHLFGVVLLNDWSGRDIQAWEYQPLGPFLSKSFCTTISPWIVTMEALAPFRSASPTRPDTDPEVLPHLDDRGLGQPHIDIDVDAWISCPEIAEPTRLSNASYASSYWTPAQLIAHHTSNGCPLRPGDILGTGTISGPEDDQAGSLLELSRAGQRTLHVNGAERTFILDGDEITLRAHCSAPGRRTIGFGEASGTVVGQSVQTSTREDGR
jgi:fumarylacetoacetase